MNAQDETSSLTSPVQNRRRRGSRPSKELTADSKVVHVPQLWMDTILEQLEAPLGPAVTLSKLLSANELELELIQTQMAQKPMLRAEVGMRVRCANKASAE